MRILSFTALNAHLAGQTGMVGGRETGLCYLDEERAEGIIDHLANSEDDAFGMTEVWDQRLGQRIIDRSRKNFPYSVFAPCANGIGDALSYIQNNVLQNYVSRIWPGASDYLSRKAEGIVDDFSQSHYKVERRSLFSALRVFVPEDWVFWPLSHALKEPLFWGAGLLLLSRHPLENISFIPFTARADLERFAGKGILRATVLAPGADPIDVLLTHYQEGVSRHAREARRRQILQTSGLIMQSPRPAVVMGDMNVDAATEEYRQLQLALRMKDAYRAAHPDSRENPGYTFNYDNPMTKKQLGANWGKRKDGQAERQRIDYIWLDYRLAVVKAEVIRLMAANGIVISDHDAVRAAVAIAA